MAANKFIVNAVADAIKDCALSAAELFDAVNKRYAGTQSIEVQEAAWELISRDEAELTVDLKLSKTNLFINMHNTEIQCLVCGKKLKPIDSGNSKPQEGCWNDAVVDAFMGGYGSKFDLSRFIFGLCDDCLEKKLKDGILIEDKEQEAMDWRERYAESRRIAKSNVVC